MVVEKSCGHIFLPGERAKKVGKKDVSFCASCWRRIFHREQNDTQRERELSGWLVVSDVNVWVGRRFAG